MFELKKLIKNQHGQVLILAALLIAALMGFTALAVDISSAYYTRSKLQAAADSAALAGAAMLPNTTSAVNTALAYAASNGLDTSEQTNITDGVDSKEVRVTVTNDVPPSVKVICKRTVNYGFGKVIGFNTGNPQSTSVAKAGSLSGVPGLKPWALNDDYTYTYGEQFILKNGGGGGSNGYFGIIHFYGQGGDANTYKSNILDGYSGTVSIGDTVYDASGNKNVKKDINELMDRSGHPDDYTNAAVGNSRVVIVPRIDSSNKVIGFAVLYLDSVDNKGFITATFLYDTTWSSSDQASHDNFGLNAKAKLVE